MSSEINNNNDQLANKFQQKYQSNQISTELYKIPEILQNNIINSRQAPFFSAVNILTRR
jgi:hypothetical protein